MDAIVEHVRRFPDVDLESLTFEGLADPRDLALAKAIEQVIARRWLTLQALLAPMPPRGWDALQPELRGALLVGSAQILLLDRVPEHAVVHDTVEWTKRRVHPKAGGMVNAILRRVIALRGETVETFDMDRRDHLPLPDGRALELREPVFAEEPAHRLAQQTGHADALIAHWAAVFGFERARMLARHGLVLPPIVVTGLAPERERDETLQPHEADGFFIYTGAMAHLAEMLAHSPTARVQDVGTARAVELARDCSPRVVADVCAGRGTKTKQLAAMFPNAEILAGDIDSARRTALRESTAALPNVRIIDPATWPEHAGRVDLLVFDVPCSNTGVIPRRPEARSRFRLKNLGELVTRQQQIIANNLFLLRRGGRVLYITCSLEPQENDAQAEGFTRRHPFRAERLEHTRPRGLPGEPPAGYRDGGFAALFAPR